MIKYLKYLCSYYFKLAKSFSHLPLSYKNFKEEEKAISDYAFQRFSLMTAVSQVKENAKHVPWSSARVYMERRKTCV